MCEYVEVGTAGYAFDADADGWPEQTGTFTDFGSIDRVGAMCGECGHRWTLRGVVQITDLREDL